MFEHKIASGIVGAELVLCAIGAIWAYGKTQYYKGRISARNEFMEALYEVKEDIKNGNIHL